MPANILVATGNTTVICLLKEHFPYKTWGVLGSFYYLASFHDQQPLDIMGLPLPQQLRIPCAFLGALGIVTFALRCFVRLRIVKAWGPDDTFITLGFVC